METVIEYLTLVGLLLIGVAFVHASTLLVWFGLMLLIAAVVLHFVARRPEFRTAFEDRLWH
ncbi:MAG: hypothetical protein HQM02_03730 [Magnetococcales bacterium]|nr:hypothetical protein [Magnetococcales bacterium]